MPYYLDTWVGSGTEADPFRPALADVVADWTVIDLRRDPTVAAGRCLVRCDAPPSLPADTVRLSDTPDGQVGKVIRTRIEQRLGLASGALADVPLYRIVLDLLTDHATEDGTRWRPLKPLASGPNTWEVHLGGLLYSVPRIQGGATYTESWPGANTTTLGGDLTWTEVAGDWERRTNKASNVDVAGSLFARADHDLAGTDQSVQAVLDQPQDTISRGGVAARFASAATTCYVFWARNNATTTYRLAKWVTGTQTVLTSISTTAPTFPATIKIEVNGSSVKGFVGGTEVITATDTGITTGTRGGLFIEGQNAANDVYLDDVTIADLGASAQTITVTGIASAAAFGTAQINLQVDPTGIASSAAFGTPTINPGPVTITPTGIASTAAFGTPTVSDGTNTIITAVGIASTAGFGNPRVGAGTVTPTRRAFQAELNRLANGGIYPDHMEAAQGAANRWAGTTGRALQGAVNTKAGTSGKATQGALNQRAGTSGLAEQKAAQENTP